jgi:hypothetical protein
MGWTQKRILVLGVEFRFCFIALFTTLHCTLHGRRGGGRQLCSVAIQKTAFLFSGGSDGWIVEYGGWVVG